MAMSDMKTWIGLGGVMLLLAGCGSNEGEVKAMAAAMPKPQGEAFTTCVKDLKRRQPIFIEGKNPAQLKATQLTEVPLDVCACHSLTMVKIFKPEKLAGHARFASYIAKSRRNPELKMGKNDMKANVDPVKGAARLAESLKTCATDFVSKNAELGKGLIVPFELPKPKEKKKEGDAAAEQQASKS